METFVTRTLKKRPKLYTIGFLLVGIITCIFALQEIVNDFIGFLGGVFIALGMSSTRYWKDDQRQ